MLAMHGWREGGETHFEVTMTADAFAGKSRVECHRMVNHILAAELASSVHALQLKLSPDPGRLVVHRIGNAAVRQHAGARFAAGFCCFHAGGGNRLPALARSSP